MLKYIYFPDTLGFPPRQDGRYYPLSLIPAKLVPSFNSQHSCKEFEMNWIKCLIKIALYFSRQCWPAWSIARTQMTSEMWSLKQCPTQTTRDMSISRQLHGLYTALFQFTVKSTGSQVVGANDLSSLSPMQLTWGSYEWHLLLNRKSSTLLIWWSKRKVQPKESSVVMIVNHEMIVSRHIKRLTADMESLCRNPTMMGNFFPVEDLRPYGRRNELTSLPA